MALAVASSRRFSPGFFYAYIKTLMHDKGYIITNN